MTPKVLYCFPQCGGESFRPSNGMEGMIFTEAFCERCIHEKFMHTQQHGDMQCDILNRTMLHDKVEDGYPTEWIYNDEGWPVCTAWKYWDWGRDDDGNWKEPPPAPIDDPNQLMLPFILDEIGVPKTEPQTV